MPSAASGLPPIVGQPGERQGPFASIARSTTCRIRTEGAPRLKRSIVKALTYRVLIVSLDFAAIYLFTGQIELALGFMIASNIYTTVAYVIHDQIWSGITWGREVSPVGSGNSD